MAFVDYIFLFGEAGKLAEQVDKAYDEAKADDGRIDAKEAAGIAIGALFTLLGIVARIIIKK